jgi:signal transduction histidine kinase
MAVSDAERITYLALIVGAWRENSDRVNASLEAARRAARAPDTYKNSFAHRSAMNEMTGDLLRGLIDSRVAPSGRRAAFHRELSLQRDAYSGNLRGLWLESQARLDELLASRASAIGQKIAWMTGLSFLAIVLGVGSAAHMFKSTLKRLDEVEAARLEAEAMSSRLEVINSEIAGLNGELSATVTQLKDAQDELLSKGRMEQLGHLTATVAHELRNPLGAVRTSVFLLQRKLSGKGLGVEPQLLRINNGVVRCDDIITQLLDFSRSSSPSLQPEDLDGWLQKVLEEEAQHLPSMVEIEFIPGLGGAPVAIDGARLSRAIINLINNASEAMVGKGDDPSKFTTHQPRITIESKASERGFEVVVRDNGPGIAPEHLARIMEPLFTTKSFGTGLGLPAVQRIMEQHGGGLEIQSALGKGSSFTAWIAAQQQATAA